MADVFISYSRRDKAFVQVLYDALRASQYDTWIDWQDIAPTTEWWQEIETGIEAAHTFIFVISPDSVGSTYCRQEVDHAVQHGKRLIPILRRSDFEQSQIPPKLGQHQWLMFQPEDDFDIAFATLVETINTDLEHKKTHTRLQVRAIEWQQQNQDASLLLRGRELEAAEQWLIRASTGKDPAPTELQKDYLASSVAARRSANTRQRATIGVLAALLLGAIGAGSLAWVQYGRTQAALGREGEARELAEQRLNEAEAARQAAEEAQANEAEQRQIAEDALSQAKAAQNAEMQQRQNAERLLRRAERGEAKAQQQTRRAVNARQIALSQQLAAQARVMLNQRPHMLQPAALLAVEATRRNPSPNADFVMRNFLSISAELKRVTRTEVIEYPQLEETIRSLSPDFRVEIISSTGYESAQTQDSETLKILILEDDSNKEVASFETNSSRHDNLRKVLLSKSGNLLVLVEVAPGGIFDRAEISVWHIPSRRRVLTLPCQCLLFGNLTISPDDKYLAFSDGWMPGSTDPGIRDKAIQVYNIETAEEIYRISSSILGARHLSFLENGNLVTQSWEYQYYKHSNTALKITKEWSRPLDNSILKMEINIDEQDVHSDIYDGSLFFSEGDDYLAFFTDRKSYNGQSTRLDIFDVKQGKSVSSRMIDLPYSFSPICLSSDGRSVLGVAFNDSRYWAMVFQAKFGKIDDYTLSENNMFGRCGRAFFRASRIPLSQPLRGWSFSYPPGISGNFILGLAKKRGSWSTNHNYMAVPIEGTIENRKSHFGVFTQILEVASGKIFRKILNEGRLGYTSISSNGKYLAIWDGRSRFLNVFNTLSGRRIASLAHEHWAGQSAFSPDSRFLASVGNDGAVKIWDMASFREVSSLQVGDYGNSWGIDVEFSSDGKFLAIGQRDAVLLARWNPNDLVSLACARLGRNLAPVEWEQYLGDEPYRETCPGLPVPEY